MSNPFRDTRGIQVDEAPVDGETGAIYHQKLSRVNIPVTIKTGDQEQGLRELVEAGGKAGDYKPWSGITIREERHFNDNRFFIYENGITVGSINASAPRVAELFQLAIMEHVRPATEETFARVAKELRGDQK